MMKLSFTTACLEDIPAIIELVNSSYRPHNANCSWTNESKIISGNRINQQQASALIQNTDNTLMLGFDNSELIASVLIEKTHDSAKIGLLTVAIQHQQQGIGKQMLRAAEDYIAKNLNLHKINMNVLLIRKELIDFYCRHGYRKTGIVKPYPENLGVGTPLIKHLMFEILEKSLATP
jgi:ribosomal protein S18 acetylase RimI-like enzyme